jgi:hypothetical protein
LADLCEVVSLSDRKRSESPLLRSDDAKVEPAPERLSGEAPGIWHYAADGRTLPVNPPTPVYELTLPHPVLHCAGFRPRHKPSGCHPKATYHPLRSRGALGTRRSHLPKPTDPPLIMFPCQTRKPLMQTAGICDLILDDNPKNAAGGQKRAKKGPKPPYTQGSS